jgi:hypothetical protein
MRSEEFRYYTRYALMEAKKAFGLRLSGERNHISERILRGIASGHVSPQSALTSTIETDGFGSQALARLSVKAAAADLKVRYVHTPFVTMEHAEGPPAEWVAKCETFLDLGRDCVRRAESDLPVIDCMEFIGRKDLWSTPHAIAVKNAYHYCNLNPEVYARVTPHLARTAGDAIKVAVHVRRGDVSSLAEPHRFTSDAAIQRSLERLLSVLDAQSRPYVIDVFTNAPAEELAMLRALPCTIHSDLGALDTFDSLRGADILFSAKSSFSYLAALYCRGIVVYEPYRGRQRAEWIVRNAAGDFSGEALASRLTTV